MLCMAVVLPGCMCCVTSRCQPIVLMNSDRTTYRARAAGATPCYSRSGRKALTCGLKQLFSPTHIAALACFSPTGKLGISGPNPTSI